MRFATEHLWFSTRKHRDYINITGKVEEIVRASGVEEDLCPFDVGLDERRSIQDAAVNVGFSGKVYDCVGG